MTEPFHIIRFGDEGLCLHEHDLLKLGRYKKTPVTVVNDATGERFNRKMVDGLSGTGKTYLIDTKTGSLYDPVTWKCKTSANLRIAGFHGVSPVREAS